MTAHRARQLKQMRRVFEREGWAPGGQNAGMSAYGAPGPPCMEDAAAQIGGHSLVRWVRGQGRGAAWNDRQRSKRAVLDELDRMTPRQEGCLQTETKTAEPKKTRKVRQHPGAAPASSSGSRLGTGNVLAAVAVLVVLGVVIRYHAVILEGLAVLVVAVVVAAAAWCGHALCEAIDWEHVAAWWARNRARAAQRRQYTAEQLDRHADLAARVADAHQPIALPYRPQVTTDDVLKQDWTRPARTVAEPVHRATTPDTTETNA